MRLDCKLSCNFLKLLVTFHYTLWIPKECNDNPYSMIRCSGASMSTASCIMKRSRKVIMFPENQPGTSEPFTIDFFICCSAAWQLILRLRLKCSCTLLFLLRSCSWSDVISDFITFKLSDKQPFFRAWDFSACKISANGILQGHGNALARIIFQDFGVRWLLVQILVPPKVKIYPAISCLKCLLLALNKAA